MTYPSTVEIYELLLERQKSLCMEIEAADARLSEIAATLERDGLTVLGSRGNLRPHGLLAVEREVRRDRARALDQLESVLRKLHAARQVEAANTIWRRTTLATGT